MLMLIWVGCLSAWFASQKLSQKLSSTDNLASKRTFITFRALSAAAALKIGSTCYRRGTRTSVSVVCPSRWLLESSYPWYMPKLTV